MGVPGVKGFVFGLLNLVYSALMEIFWAYVYSGMFLTAFLCAIKFGKKIYYYYKDKTTKKLNDILHVNRRKNGKAKHGDY